MQAEETVQDEQQQEKRKPGRPRGSTKSKAKSAPKKSPGRPSLWLEKKEAEIISSLIQYGILARYGTMADPPSQKKQDHLAHVIKKYSDVFPLSFIQGFIRSLLPLSDPASKPGRSTLGDLAQYAAGWHQANPDLYQEVLAQEQIYIPFITPPPDYAEQQDLAFQQAVRIPPKNEVEGMIGRRITDDQYDLYVSENYGGMSNGANGRVQAGRG